MPQEAPSRDFDLLKSLEVFVSVTETGNMTAAAARLHITQSAISQQIKILETHLGAPLFYRDVRPLRLTPSGLALKTRAGPLLQAARDMRVHVREAAAGKAPHLRISILSTFARQLAPAIVQAVKDHSLPVETFSVSRGMAINHAQDLANREIDVAWTSDDFARSTILDRVPLVRETYFVVTPPGYGRFASDLGKLSARIPFLRYSTRTQSGQRIENHLRRLRFTFPGSPTFEASIDLIDAIASGSGWSIVTPSQVFDLMGTGVRIEARPLPGPGLTRTLGLVWRTGEMQDLMLQLADVCASTLRDRTAARLRAELPDLAGHFEVLQTP